MSEGITMKPLTIDADRLWQSLMDLAQIGATPKGRREPH